MADRLKIRKFDQWLNFKAIANILNPIKNAYGLSGMTNEYFNFIDVKLVL